MKDGMDIRRLQSALAGQRVGQVVEFHDEIGSTNDRAHELARGGHPHGCVVISERQTAGRGRRGASWCGVPGSDVMLSVLLRPEPEELAGRIPLLAALALARAVSGQAALRPLVKWPNDLWLNGRKLAGVLTETEGPAVILGIGCNVNSVESERPAEVKGVAVSMREGLGGDRWLDRTGVVLSLLRELQGLWAAVGDRARPELDFPLESGRAALQGAGQRDPGRWSEVLRQLASVSQLSTGSRVEVASGGRVFTAKVEGLGCGGELVVNEDGRRRMLYQVDRIRPLWPAGA